MVHDPYFSDRYGFKRRLHRTWYDLVLMISVFTVTVGALKKECPLEAPDPGALLLVSRRGGWPTTGRPSVARPSIIYPRFLYPRPPPQLSRCRGKFRRSAGAAFCVAAHSELPRRVQHVTSLVHPRIRRAVTRVMFSPRRQSAISLDSSLYHSLGASGS